MNRGAEGPVRHAARLVLIGRLVEHADPATRVALLRADDRAHVVAELLVLRIAGRGAREDPVGNIRLTPQECEVSVVFRRAGGTLPREPVAVCDLAPLHPGSGEAEARVAPDR